MTFAASRAAALRSTLRTATRRPIRPRLLGGQAARRFASSGPRKEGMGDLPYIVGAMAFTIPAANYILDRGYASRGSYGHHASDEEGKHGKPEVEVEEEKEVKGGADEGVAAEGGGGSGSEESENSEEATGSEVSGNSHEMPGSDSSEDSHEAAGSEASQNSHEAPGSDEQASGGKMEAK